MNDFIAGPASGTGDGGTGLGNGGAPPTVLIVALGAAVLIAATLVGFLLGSGGGDAGPAGGVGVDDPGAAVATTGDDKRVVLTVQVDGGGSGSVLIDPSGDTCSETCKHTFAIGTRVSLSPDAESGSSFDGWSEACSGKGRCSFAMDRPREVTVTFESSPTQPQCTDGRDNDGDGLIDEADPGCDANNTEAPDNRSAPGSAPAPASASDCHDGRDNDGDGLVDAAQDPNCANGGTEAGSVAPPKANTTTTPPPPPPLPASECSDGRDNDGDGLIDRPADPGCDANGTEANSD
jgi:hypothetical protein